MIQFVSGNIEQATELMLFNSAEILLKLELYLKNIFQIRSNTSFKYKYKYTNLVFFKYKYKYKYKYLNTNTNTNTYLDPALPNVPRKLWYNIMNISIFNKYRIKKKLFNGSHITIIQFDFKRKIIFDKVVIWWLFANVPRMLGENVQLTRFEYQRFNRTTKVDTIHIVYTLVIIRLHLHIPY